MERKYNNQTEDSRLQGDLSDSHCSQDETIQEARFCLCCSWAEGCGKCPEGWQPDVPPSWPSLLQDEAEMGSRGQWWVGKDTHQSLCLSSPPAGVLVKSLDQAEHQPCHCSSPGSVTSCPSMETLAWPFPDVCQRFPEAAEQRKRGGREYNENWGNNSEKRKMSGNRPCAAVLAALW